MYEGDASTWTEEESQLYLQLAPVAIPARDEQIATIVSLLPFGAQSHFHALDLGAGEGALAFAILASYPNASLSLLDGSETMRDRARRCLDGFGNRATVQPFELGAPDWLPLINTSNIVVSSLLLHHLTDSQKPEFFETVFQRLLQPGALLIADIIQAHRPEQVGLLASTYDAVVRAQSIAMTGSEKAYEIFTDKEWNFFRCGFATSGEHPFSLADTLAALQSSGFDGVDCFWLKAGFAVFGGYKGRRRSGVGVPWEAALRAARLGLDTASRLREEPSE